MENKFYGVNQESIKNVSQIDLIIEEISTLGYSIIPNVLSNEESEIAASKLDYIYDKQVESFGFDKLISIGESNLVRCPLAYDDFFLELCTKPVLMNVVEHFLGEYFIINQQNGIVNFPNEKHHQSSWHRDLPYQNYVISQPIAISCLVCLDDFTEETGSTILLPFSHQLSKIPSLNYIDKHKISSTAKKGSVLIFNSMLFHKAGNNTSNIIRRGLNTLFSIPLLKQQINLQAQLKGKHAENVWLSKLLGYESQVPENVDKWRENKVDRLKK